MDRSINGPKVSPRSGAQGGLPSGGDRRALGLRREELAALAGLSVDYIVRLEQGRARIPSAVTGQPVETLRIA